MQSYLVGGAVRDELLGREVHDRDYVVTGMTIEQMKQQGFVQVGADFPVFLHPKTKEEYALARTERKSGHGYKGFSVDFNPQVSLEEDLLRRDLTINAIAKDSAGGYVDPYGGIADIEQRVLRHVSDAFAEDPLRVLRVARFAAQLKSYGFNVADSTITLMKKLADDGELACLTPERIFKEMEKALCSDSPEVFFTVLKQSEGLMVLLPEFAQFAQGNGNGNFTSAMAALVRTAKLSKEPEVRWAALLCALSYPAQALPTSLALAARLNLRLKTPNRYAHLCQKVMSLSPCYKLLSQPSAAALLELLQQLDVLRRPDILPPFVAACRGALGLGQCDPIGTYLTAAATICAEVVATPFVEQGLKGAKIKLAMDAERLVRLTAYVRSL